MNPFTQTSRLPRAFAVLVLLGAPGLLMLTGCSSSDGGNNPVFGNGQNPDPATVDFAVAYIKRTLPTPPDELDDDARDLRATNVDADVYMRDRASPSVVERNITARITGEPDGDENRWDVKDLDASFDGTKLLFAMRGPMIPNGQEEDQPTWNIWEYTVATDTLRRVISSDITAEEGHDVAPHYLPDGRIVFSSTRQRQSKAILLDEGKPQYSAQLEGTGGGAQSDPAFVLHVMNADGSDIHQVSFNQSHDLDPTVLADGRIMFTRWDHAPGNNGMHLYTMKPDGRELELLFGANSHDYTPPGSTTPIQVQFLQPRLLENGKVMALVRPFAGTDLGADIAGIDVNNYVENTQPTLPNRGVLSGPAMQKIVINDVRIAGNRPSPGGVFSAAFPMFDGSNRLFVSWSLCRVIENGVIVPCTEDRLNNPNSVRAPPMYGIWIYDLSRDTQQPVVPPEEGIMITEIVAMKPRALPAVILDGVAGVDLDANLVNDNAGVLHIRSVYDMDGVDTAPGGIAAVRDPANPAYATRPARFLRIEKAVSIPDEDVRDFRNTAFGASNFMREVVGYAPVEPDGSVRVKVPADVALSISVVDAQGRRLPGALGARHNNWLQVRPGEVVECNGCHNPATTNPPQSHGRRNLFARANPGAPGNGAFPNTNGAIALVDMGDTMAQARGRVMCGGACSPSMVIALDDYWSGAGITPQASIDLCYSTGGTDIIIDPGNPNGPGAPRHNCTSALTTLSPVSMACERAWNGSCRITINYERHIHPLWGIDRFVDADNDTVPDIDPVTSLPINHRCTGCHAPVNMMNMAQVPAGQLDLSDGASDQEPDHFKSYRELLFTDNEQILDMGALRDRTQDGPLDPVTGLPTQLTFPVQPSMTAAGARASTRFFSRFDAGGSHEGYLTKSELRLIAEWLDIGAQYYNNPFDAPLN